MSYFGSQTHQDRSPVNIFNSELVNNAELSPNDQKSMVCLKVNLYLVPLSVNLRKLT